MILVDDSSTDDGAEVIWGFDDPRIQLIQLENQEDFDDKEIHKGNGSPMTKEARGRKGLVEKRLDENSLI
jgi:hypothetical protein